MTNDNKTEELFDIVNDLNIAMFVSENDGQLRSRPMKVFPDTVSNEFWFLTKLESPKISEIASEAQVNLSFACPKSHDYVSVSGVAVRSHDQDKIDEMWSDDMAVWFDCEKTDPNVAAICVIPTTAEYWDGKSNAVSRMWEVTKSKLTGEKPDLGDNETVRLAS